MSKKLEPPSETCHVCGYDVSASPAAVCSECGMTRVPNWRGMRKPTRGRMICLAAVFATVNAVACGVLGHAVSAVWPDSDSLPMLIPVLAVLACTSLFCYLIKPIDRTAFLTELLITVFVAGMVACAIGLLWRFGGGEDFFYPVGPLLVAVFVFCVGGSMIQGVCLLVRCCGPRDET